MSLDDYSLRMNKFVDLYNQGANSLDGLEKLINLRIGLKRIFDEFEDRILSEIRNIVTECTAKHSNRDIEIDEEVQKIYRRLIDNSEELIKNDVYETVTSEFEGHELLDVDYGDPDYDDTYVDELAAGLFFLSEELEASFRLHLTLVNLDSILIRNIINKGFPQQIGRSSRASKIENMKKKLDVKKEGHAHRKEDIQRKYKELKKQFPALTDSEIRSSILEWYLELTGKEIGESTVRYHLGQK